MEVPRFLPYYYSLRMSVGNGRCAGIISLRVCPLFICPDRWGGGEGVVVVVDVVSEWNVRDGERNSRCEGNVSVLKAASPSATSATPNI